MDAHEMETETDDQVSASPLQFARRFAYLLLAVFVKLSVSSWRTHACVISMIICLTGHLSFQISFYLKSDYILYIWCSITSYQVEALEKAIKQNTIVFLETGSGKTLIAIMLLRSYAYLFRKPSPCFCVFLVPQVVLVSQVSFFCLLLTFIVYVECGLLFICIFAHTLNLREQHTVGSMFCRIGVRFDIVDKGIHEQFNAEMH